MSKSHFFQAQFLFFLGSRTAQEQVRSLVALQGFPESKDQNQDCNINYRKLINFKQKIEQISLFAKRVRIFDIKM